MRARLPWSLCRRRSARLPPVRTEAGSISTSGLLALALLSSLVGVAADPAEARPPDERVQKLRESADYAKAADVARAWRDSLRGSEGAPAWELETAKHLVSTCATVAALPDSLQKRMAEGDRLTWRHRAAHWTGENKEAYVLAERQLAIREAILGPEHLETGITLSDLGLYHDASWQELDLGEQRFRRSLAIHRRVLDPRHPDLAMVLERLGSMLLRRDSYEGARPLLRESLEIRLEVLGEDHVDTGATLHRLAYLEKSFGRDREALDLASQALASFRQSLTYREALLAESMVLVGVLHGRLGELEEAETHYREALSVTRQRVGEDGWQVSWIQDYLANVLTRRGRYEEAYELLGEAEERIRRIDPDHLQLFQILRSKGRLALLMERYEEAEPILADALERDRALRETDANNSIVTALQHLAIARFHLGMIESSESLLAEAVDGYEAARLRVQEGIDRARFTNTPYVPRALLQLELGRFQEAWESVEHSHGRVLADLVKLSSSTGVNVSALSLERIQASLGPNTALIGWLDHHLYDGSPRHWGYVIRRTGPVRWVSLPASIGTEGDPSLAHSNGEPAADPADALSIELSQRLDEFRSLISLQGGNAFELPRMDSDLRQELRRVGEDRIGALETHLNGIEHLVVVPSWPMHGVPIETLQLADGTLLGERFATTYAPSATIYAQMASTGKSSRRSPTRAFLVGDPPFRPDHVLAAATPLSSDRANRSILRRVVRGDRAAVGSLPRMPWSRDEVTGIAGRFDEAEVLLGSQASRAKLSQLATTGQLKQYDVLHLATHALVDESSLEYSAFVLSQVNLEGTDDGLLTAREVFESWDLDADLVVLSACETGLGETIVGEGVVGFAYPFFKAGARSLLMSLWEVDDHATSLFMTRFYEEWLSRADRGVPAAKAEALRATRLWLRSYTDAEGAQPYVHPYFWASFILVGDPG